MRKIKALFFAVFLILTVLAVGSCDEAPGPDLTGEELDGLIYELLEDENAYELIGVSEELEEYTVAASINGLPVIAVGNSAFYSNTTVKRVHLPDSIVRIEAYAFDDCFALEEIVFPSGIEIIGFNAFSDCTSLKLLKLPASLKEIRAYAFARCTGLQKIYVNPALELIEKDAFLSCDAISEIHLESVAAWCGIEFENIDANPISMAESLFLCDEPLENLTVSGVDKISDYAFFGFSGIKSLILGEGVEFIGSSAFSNCSGITRLELSDSVKTVGKSAFNSCSSLEYVVIGKGVERFEGLAFYACSAIYAVEVKDLAAWCDAFFYTDNSGTANPLRYADELIVDGKTVDNLVIPDGVKRITTLAFIGFRGSSVSLPNSMRVIEDTAFYMCDNLVGLHFRGTRNELSLMSIGYNNFANVDKISYNG